MSAIGAIIAGVAAKVGAELVGKAVGGRFGQAGGELAESVIKSVAERAGVAVEELPAAPPATVEEAVLAVDAEMPEILDAHLRQMAEMNAQFRAEMTAEPTWVWGWRPAGMWLFNALVVWYVVLVPLINLALGLAGASERVVLIVEAGAFVTLYLTFCGFYMGGHTLKDVAVKVRDGLASRKAPQ